MAIKTVSWFSDILAYFAFVGARRKDNEHPVLPVLAGTVIPFLLVIFTIILLIIFVDPIFLAWIKQPDRDYPQIFQWITRLGQVHWVLVPTGIALIILSLFRANRFKGKQNLVWHRIFLNVWFAFTAIAYSGLLVMLLKNIFGRGRPPVTPEGAVWLFQPFDFSYNFASFPSGHATTGGAIAMVLILLFPRWKWFFILSGLAIAISRPVLGVHFPSDVLAGISFGAGFVWIYARIFAQKRLLFTFTRQGKLKLRGEGEGKMHLLGTMVAQTMSGKSKTS